MRVAVLTLFKGNYNYGGMLQAYALPYVINKMRKNACQIAHTGGGVMRCILLKFSNASNIH